MSVTAVNMTSPLTLAMIAGAVRKVEAPQRKTSNSVRASDGANAGYWSITTSVRAHELSLSSADDATAIAAAIADTAALGIEAAAGVVSEIQSKLVAAQGLQGGRADLNEDISELKAQLGTIAASSGFNGENWLQLEAGKRSKVESVIASVSTGADGEVSVKVIDFDTARSILINRQDAEEGILTRSYSGFSNGGDAYAYYLIDAGSAVPVSGQAREISISDETEHGELDGMISSVNAIFARLADAGTVIGTTRLRIAAGTDMLKDLQEAHDIGIGRMVDAELGEQAVRLKAIAAQQQLQTESFSIVNRHAAPLAALLR